MNIAQSVKDYVTSHGIKHVFIAEKCGWSKQKASFIINGKKGMTVDELIDICDALGVSYDFFFQKADDRKSTREGAGTNGRCDNQG